MKRDWRIKGLRFAAFGLIALAVCGVIVMSLWNWLMPEIFGAHAIGFWQALGLIVLSKLLFGGFRGWPGRRMHGRRWARMTPEEREKFREGMRQRCGQA